jgi:hypothetical protein
MFIQMRKWMHWENNIQQEGSSGIYQNLDAQLLTMLHDGCNMNIEVLGFFLGGGGGASQNSSCCKILINCSSQDDQASAENQVYPGSV